MPKKKSNNSNYLILFRHGQSRWNRTNQFTGWADIPLSEIGIQESLICAKKLEGLRIDTAFCSKLARAEQALLTVISKQDSTGYIHHEKNHSNWYLNFKAERQIPIYLSEKLNERYYGDLQGMDKGKASKKYGKDQVFLWRRSYDARPPKGESLEDAYKRVVPYFTKEIMPHVKKKKNVIVSAHGNSLRAIIKHIENISDDDIPRLEFLTGTFVIYKYSTSALIKQGHIYSFQRQIHWSGNNQYKIQYQE
ncbi:histidine phosphatase family protein [Patescibacteria group bacterium]|nr:histidine phosphatase family protein [Patescibacteria group bacterium]